MRGSHWGKKNRSQWFGGMGKYLVLNFTLLIPDFGRISKFFDPQFSSLLNENNSFLIVISLQLNQVTQIETSGTQFSSVPVSRVQLFATPWTAAHQASPSITNSQRLLKLMSIESVMPSNHLILSSSPSPPAFNLSQHQGLFR